MAMECAAVGVDTAVVAMARDTINSTSAGSDPELCRPEALEITRTKIDRVDMPILAMRVAKEDMFKAEV